jgi:hypothetical protein
MRPTVNAAGYVGSMDCPRNREIEKMTCPAVPPPMAKGRQSVPAMLIIALVGAAVESANGVEWPTAPEMAGNC